MTACPFGMTVSIDLDSIEAYGCFGEIEKGEGIIALGWLHRGAKRLPRGHVVQRAVQSVDGASQAPEVEVRGQVAASVIVRISEQGRVGNHECRVAGLPE